MALQKTGPLVPRHQRLPDDDPALALDAGDRRTGIVQIAAWLIVGAIVIGLLYFGRDVLIPLAIAFLVSFALGPLVKVLVRRGIPQVAAVLLVMLAVIAALLGLGLLITSQVSVLSAELPAYQSTIRSKIAGLGQQIEGPGLFDGVFQTITTVQEQLATALQDTPGSVADPMAVTVVGDGPSPFSTAMAWLAPALAPLATLGIVVVFVFLVLLDRGDLRDRLIRLLGGNLHRTTDALEEAGKRISKYLLMQLVVNATYGIPMAIGLWAIGVPGWILWGTLAAIMRFIPYVGPMLSAIFPLALAFAVDPGWQMVLMALALILILELVSNNIVEPLLYGTSTGLSALSLIAAATFWTALWGPVGLILSTPLTVCLLVLGRNLPQLAFFDTLLGSTPALDLPTRIYQRLIANDPDEAYEIASDAIRISGVTAFYNQTGIEILRQATDDYHANARVEHRLRVVDGMDRLLDDLQEDHPAPADTASAEKVVCIGGKWQVDAISAQMLVHALCLSGVAAGQRATGVVTTAYVDKLELDGIRTVVLSYFSRDPDTAVRGFVRRLRRRWPDVRIVLALWNAPEDSIAADRAESLGVDQIVLSLDEAVQRLSLSHADSPQAAAEAGDAAGERARLAALAATAVLDGHAREELDDLAARAADAFDVDFAFISVVDADAEYIVGQSMDLAGQKTETAPEMIWMPRGEGLSSPVVTSGETLVVSDTERDARFSDHPAVRRWKGRFYIATPLRTSDDQVIGALCLMDDTPRQIEDGDLDFLDKVAADVVSLLTEQDPVAPEPRREVPPDPRAMLGQRVPD
ncbi:AI-2E family transporter [Paracoccus sediminis]|uniref:AI-2E family transporter n=1 Tax=Paracoccus sediminis TaxID=1214787 RepID=A0A238XRY9_9RHOB|nr:AI-2E family transporter [Paracoccus sediminis]TBN47897.1 AI-2E family transporter [Paracoccus sediminis]SNR61480.1 Predicted PurR-regulated permease PerM [Paracoccus sediminis]